MARMVAGAAEDGNRLSRPGGRDGLGLVRRWTRHGASGAGQGACGFMSDQPNPTPLSAFANADAYSDWINRRLGEEVTRLREAHGMTPYALGLKCGVSDQTILNIEHGKCERGYLTGTLARICFHFGITLNELLDAAEAVAERPGEEVGGCAAKGGEGSQV